MKTSLVTFGKAGSPFVADEVARYRKRLRGVRETEIVELKESRQSDRLAGLAEEARLFEKRFPAGSAVRVILAEEGKGMNTLELARWLEARQSQPWVFLVGSAYGIAPELKQSADLLLSLSPLTLTHDHARVLLAEQVYRCLMVMKGHPYHHV
jgi:23S rRNA (pseudouridine1915-N3)-methyltransferase